jgi:uncharacterized membrane protein YjgN (DUF898 family)
MDKAAQAGELSVEFSASGSEYFRIWIVNLLLVVLTLGLYLPFAKARRLRYFYANTQVGGTPLAFHGDPWRMFRGYLVMLVLFGSSALANAYSAWTSLLGLGVLAALWPALWRSSMRFRLANTSWRGLRFGFDGSLRGAYLALLPMFAPAAMLLAVSAWAMQGVDKADPAAVDRASQGVGPAFLAIMLLALLLLPLALWLVKRYQHDHYRLAAQVTQLSVGPGAFYTLSFKATILGLLAMVTVLGTGWLAASAIMSAGRGKAMAAGVAAALLLTVAYVALLSLVAAYMAARMQDLTWNHTRSAALRFRSRLSAKALATLTIRNLLLVVLTLGLYRPFAVVATHRLRLQSTSLEVDAEFGRWTATPAAVAGGASGEMAGDFFGIDVGL